MSTEYRVVPVEPTEEMVEAVIDLGRIDPEDVEAIWAGMLDAAPMPPTGREVEVLGFRYRSNGGPWEFMEESPFADGRTHHSENGEELVPVYEGPEVVAWRSSDAFGAVYGLEPGRPADEYHGLIALEDHRAHVTLLQAEVERLNNVRKNLRRHFTEMIDQAVYFENECEALQFELTKARELIDKWAGLIYDQSVLTAFLEMRDYLAHQSAPAAKNDKCMLCDGAGTISTGIDEASSTICNNCDGLGKVAP